MYNPDITEDDWEDMSEREKKALYETASVKYNAKHSEINQSEINLTKEATTKAEAFLSSVKLATETLYKNEAIRKEEVSKIEQKMKTNIGDIFFNPDNTYKQDAAERLYFAMNGKDIVQALISKLQAETKREISKAKSEALETAASTFTNDQPRKVASGGSSISIEDAVKEMLPPQFTQVKT
jgi:hypothetical protein